MEIDDEIKSLCSQGSRQAPVVEYAAGPARPLGDDHVIDMRIVLHDRGRARLDKVRDLRVGEALAQRGDGGRRKHHIADQAQANQQNVQGSTVASSMSITGMSSLIG